MKAIWTKWKWYLLVAMVANAWGTFTGALTIYMFLYAVAHHLHR